jgi:hypothetical protein
VTARDALPREDTGTLNRILPEVEVALVLSVSSAAARFSRVQRCSVIFVFFSKAASADHELVLEASIFLGFYLVMKCHPLCRIKRKGS